MAGCVGLKPGQAPQWPAGITNLSRETGVAFACAGSAPIETAIAFAGEKWAFWVRFSVAEVSLVSTSSRHSCLCAKKFALCGLMVGVCAKKFALRTKNGPKLAVYGVLGELFRGNAAGGPLLGELFRGRAAEGAVLGEVFRGTAAERTVLGEVFRGHAPEGTVPGESCRRQAAVGSHRRPPTSRAPAQREPGKPATASCRRKTPTPRRRTMQNG